LGTALVQVRTLDAAHWLCDECGQCWRVERASLRPVDLLSCHGDATRPESEGISSLQSAFPRFGAGAPTDDDEEL
jgi:hypothetical protein